MEESPELRRHSKRRREQEDKESTLRLQKKTKRAKPTTERDLESPTAVSRKRGINLVGDIESIINQLNEDFNIVSYNIDSELEIPGPIRKELSSFIQFTAKQRIYGARRLVDELKRRLGEKGSDLAVLDELSVARSAILTITQQLQAFNRGWVQGNVKKIPNTEANGKHAVASFSRESDPSASVEEIGLEQLLEEFKIAAEKPIKYVEIAASLREQLRITTSSRWKAEREARDSRIDASTYQAQLSLMERDGGDHTGNKEDYDHTLLRLEQCHQHGEELKQEIIRLRSRGAVTDSGHTSGAPPGDDESCTRHEPRDLLKMLGEFMTSSTKYQLMVTKLEGNEDECKKAIERLQDEISAMRDQDDLCRDLKEEIECLKAENAHLRQRTSVDNTPPLPTSSQKESENNRLRVKITRLEDQIETLNHDIQSRTVLDSQEQIDDLQAQLNIVEEELDTTKVDLAECKFGFLLCC